MKNIDESELLTETYHNMIYSIINKYYVQNRHYPTRRRFISLKP